MIQPGEKAPIPGNPPESPGIPRSLSEDSGTESGAEPGALQDKAIHNSAEQSKAIPEPAAANSGSHPESEPQPASEVASAGELRWEAACSALRNAYGENATINAFRQWLSRELISQPPEKEPAAVRRILTLIEKSRQKENPPGWFVWRSRSPRRKAASGTGRTAKPEVTVPSP